MVQPSTESAGHFPIVMTSSDIDDVPGEELRNCGAAAFVPKIELATADLNRLFAGEPKPGQDLR
jgi:hypothetical protein